MVRPMPTLELIELYQSPFSERVRWALELKDLTYKRRPYQPIADEPELKRTTGHSTVPVLLADGEVVGDSDVALDWLEKTRPSPALLPADPRARAAVRAWEIAATETLAPAARLVMIGRFKARDLQPLANHFEAKYGWTPDAERRAARLLDVFARDLAAAVGRSPYLVGDAFTRADLTVAVMLSPLLGLPPDDVFAIDAAMRPMFGLPLGADPALKPLHEWRDAVYRRHRGGRVVPAAA
jgi:glutathione S-transferase